jgi:phospholipid-transporting ATPase
MASFMTAKASAFISRYRDPNNGIEGAYYIFEKSPDDLGFKAFGSFYLLFNQFIPFELVIIIEMVKMYYTSWIESDVKLHNVESANSVKVQNLSILEELAQINYLFCDKTGTLTKN